MTYDQLNQIISSAVANNGDLQSLKMEMALKLKKISVFMDKFLKKYGSRLMGDQSDTPEWNLYKKKTEEYNNYARAIRNVEYFIAKENVSKL